MTREAQQPRSMSAAELLEAAEAVAGGAKRRVILVHGKSLAIVPHASKSRTRRTGPVPAAAPSARRGKRFSMNDPLWAIRGIVDGPGPTDVAAHKDAYLAEAYAAKRR